MVVTNVIGEAIAFKLKTSTPTGYTVKPTKGFVIPGGAEEITVAYRPHQQVRDWFQLEVRRLTRDEQAAVEVQDDPEQVARILKLSSPPDNLSTHLWNHWRSSSEQTKRHRLESVYTDGPAIEGTPSPGAVVSPRTVAPQNSGSVPVGETSSLTTDIQVSKKRNLDLLAEITQLQEAEAGLQRAAQIREACSDEVTSKTALPRPTLPPVLFVFFWLVFLYLGLSFEKHFS
eukprot:TRINITY_DN15441_c0_g3_i1.p2 TRINITY_DN15441_c0_g3~~TRINITY_DN15441_c0_g3_i1.p2  ORF type:complete len:269 (+),score=32.59 TRINITY_DN15441_c0_g3_i1:119-808(+)